MRSRCPSMINAIRSSEFKLRPFIKFALNDHGRDHHSEAVSRRSYRHTAKVFQKNRQRKGHQRYVRLLALLLVGLTRLQYCVNDTSEMMCPAESLAVQSATTQAENYWRPTEMLRTPCIRLAISSSPIRTFSCHRYVPGTCSIFWIHK